MVDLLLRSAPLLFREPDRGVGSVMPWRLTSLKIAEQPKNSARTQLLFHAGHYRIEICSRTDAKQRETNKEEINLPRLDPALGAHDTFPGPTPPISRTGPASNGRGLDDGLSPKPSDRSASISSSPQQTVKTALLDNQLS
jgi:hypothetical protein